MGDGPILYVIHTIILYVIHIITIDTMLSNNGVNNGHEFKKRYV